MANEYKIVIVGAGGVGKSAITCRFIQGGFVEKYDPTIEDSYRKSFEVDGVACLLDIMDTAGQEEYSSLRDQYMKTGHGFLLVYSIAAAATFEVAKNLRTRILRIKEEMPDIPVLVAGNKCDQEELREVKKEDASNYAKKIGAMFLETSAKENINIDEAFSDLVRRINAWRRKNKKIVDAERKKEEEEEQEEKVVKEKPKKKCTIL